MSNNLCISDNDPYKTQHCVNSYIHLDKGLFEVYGLFNLFNKLFPYLGVMTLKVRDKIRHELKKKMCHFTHSHITTALGTMKIPILSSVSDASK